MRKRSEGRHHNGKPAASHQTPKTGNPDRIQLTTHDPERLVERLFENSRSSRFWKQTTTGHCFCEDHEETWKSEISTRIHRDKTRLGID